jgi:putative ABC transport system permease protein
MVSQIRSLLARIAGTFRRSHLDRDINDEMEVHIALLTEDFVKRGMARRNAEFAARRQFGGIALMKQNCYEAGTLAALAWVSKDVVYALRNIRQKPGFAITAVLTLAIGIGSNTAIFSVVRAVLLKPLSYRDPEALVQLSMENSRSLATFTPIRYKQLKARTRSFSDLGAFGLLQNMMLTIPSTSEQITVARVSANVLRLLGVKPLLGRDFRDEEDVTGGNPVAIVSAELWGTRFGSDPGVIGRIAVLDSQPYSIIGVMPRGFEFPYAGVDIWLTRPAEWAGVPAQNWDRTASLTGFARLGPGVSVQQASAELAVLNQQYMVANSALPDAKAGARMRVDRLADVVVTPVRTMLWILFGAIGFVLLIACANLASLMLARAMSRSREFAIRAALGASRRRLIMQSLTESMLLALMGATVGLSLALLILKSVTHETVVALPRVGEIRLDGFVLAFTLLISAVTGVLVGLLPSLSVSQPTLILALRGHGTIINRARRWGGCISSRGLPVIAQIGLSIVLLVGAALLIKSFVRLRNVDLGFQPNNVLTMRVTLPPARYDNGQKITAFFDDVVQRIQVLPGIRYAAVARSLPTLPYQLVALQPAEQPQVPFAERPLGALQTISRDYFKLMGVSLRAGRYFTEQDFKVGRPVLMINEALARRFWPSYTRESAPVGQHLQLGPSTFPVEIVGIVGDFHEGGPAFTVAGEVYLPVRLSPTQTAYLLVRGTNDPSPMLKAIRAQVSAIDRDQTIASIKSMNELIDSALGQQRVTMIVLAAFAIAALLLTAMGLYSVIAYAVSQRFTEIGIRSALGARQIDILGLIIGQSLGLALLGLALGLAGALAMTRFLGTLLFEIGGSDPGTYAEIALLLLFVTIAASYLPARRATRIDPMVALRL